jgi:hypothetical protein
MLKNGARTRRREGFQALIDRLSDPDPDVAELALTSLRTLSGQHFDRDLPGIQRWEEWLHQTGRS